MKITQGTNGFKPIVITIETELEAKTIGAIMNHPAIDPVDNELFDELYKYLKGAGYTSTPYYTKLDERLKKWYANRT